jgi:hypothetical protein
MPTYDISVHCRDCGKYHPLFLRIAVDIEPDYKQSIAELFQDRPLPPQLRAIRGHAGFCHKTGRKFKLEKDDDIFLVSPTYSRRDSISRKRVKSAIERYLPAQESEVPTSYGIARPTAKIGS